INLVLTLFEALKVAQSVRSPWIGASVLELPALRRRLGEQADAAAIPATGLYVDDVFEPSPASRAGVRPGDFLLGLGGHPLASVSDFQTWLYVLGIGPRAELDRARDGKRTRVTVPIEVRPESAAMQCPRTIERATPATVTGHVTTEPWDFSPNGPSRAGNPPDHPSQGRESAARRHGRARRRGRYDPCCHEGS